MSGNGDGRAGKPAAVPPSNTMEGAAPPMERITALTTAVSPAYALLAGCQLDLFTALANGPATVEEVADRLGVGEAKLRPLLYAFVPAGLLTVDDGHFANTAEAD